MQESGDAKPTQVIIADKETTAVANQQESDKPKEVEFKEVPLEDRPFRVQCRPGKIITRAEMEARAKINEENNNIDEEPTERTKTAVKTVAKKTLRIFGYNVDILLALVFGFLCAFAGYVYARNKGISAQEISSWITDFLELIGILLSALVALVAKLAVNRGVIAEKINEAATTFFQETLKPKKEIDVYGNTFIGDKKVYRG